MDTENEESVLLKAWEDLLQSIPSIIHSQNCLTACILAQLNTFIEVTDDASSATSPSTITYYASGMREGYSRQKGFIEQLHQKEELEFFGHVRVRKETYAFLLNKVKEKYKPVYLGGHHPIDADTALALGLWYLGNQCTYKEMAEQFGLAISTVFTCAHKIIDIFCDMLPEVVKWPSHDEIPSVAKGFSDIAQFPGVTGALDGCHIRIKVPADMQANYKDRSNKHSLNLMAICDSKKKFTFISVGFPGSAHDNRVFRESAFYDRMVKTPHVYFPSPEYHIIGDSAFSLSHHVLVPYKNTGNLSNQQIKYNTKLYATKSVIDNAFAFLKGRFRRLKYVDAAINRHSKIIIACCVLHNIISDFPHEESFLYNEGSVSAIQEDEDYFALDICIPHDVSGFTKRDSMASLL